jgi:3-phenylpropionate/trans-cinnamate dioxygenase ferredoxin reductase subunit
VISAEADPPYNRPPLSKGLWKRQKIKHIWRHTEELNVDLHLGLIAQPLDAERKRVVTQLPDEERIQATDNPEIIFTYDRLLLATGGTPRRLPFGGDRIIYFRTLADYRRLRKLADQGRQRFAVIGGGFIGSEIAAALAMNDQDVVMIFPEAGIGGLTFPPDLSRFLNDYYREKGIEVMAGELIDDLEESQDRFILKTKNDQKLEADHVIAGLGIKPNTGLAERAGLKVDNGILVDEFLRTSDPNIYAAGDVANFYNSALDKRMRVEHEDNANTMGQHAGRSMAGKFEPYDYLPYFYSDLFDLGYEAVGELNPKLDIVADWQEANRKGVIYYLRQGRIRGVILWNVWDQVQAVRELMAETGPFQPSDLKGRLPAD